MKEVRLAFIGYGNVAQGLTRILHEKEAEFDSKYGVRFLIVAITDTTKGNAFDPEGISPAALLDAAASADGLRSLACVHPDWDAMEMIESSPVDAVIEMSVTNLETGEPATSYIAEALHRKKHVITTNKGPIALHYDQLSDTARLHGVQLGVEGTVMSGTPVLRIGRELLASAGIERIQGILNGTTNYILTRMEDGLSYQVALAEAQAHGYAEADPRSDVEGFDAAAKVAILSRLVLGTPLALDAIEREGITGITPETVAAARQENQVWRLVGTVELENGQVRGSVRPVCLPADHPLAGVRGATNAIVFSTRYLGDMTVSGPGAGRLPTGYAIIEDLFCIYDIGRSC